MNDFLCNECGHLDQDVLYNNTSDTPIVCSQCSSANLTKQLSFAHHSSDGGKGLGARTPDGFKEILKGIKKATPKSHLGEGFKIL